MFVITFYTDDDYLQWVADHPAGFVVNTGRNAPPNYMVLHRAMCGHISSRGHESSPGGYTERDFIKVCADDVESLERWTYDHGRTAEPFSTECSHCKPRG